MWTRSPRRSTTRPRRCSTTQSSPTAPRSTPSWRCAASRPASRLPGPRGQLTGCLVREMRLGTDRVAIATGSVPSGHGEPLHACDIRLLGPDRLGGRAQPRQLAVGEVTLHDPVDAGRAQLGLDTQEHAGDAVLAVDPA